MRKFGSTLAPVRAEQSLRKMNSGQERDHRGVGRGGGKRQEILAAATERFGRDGYEHTKRADIAHDVGVDPTALYHYFESKQHCLYEIMDEAIEDFRGQLRRDHHQGT